MAAEIKALFTYHHIYLHADPEKDVQVLRVEQRILNFVKLCAILLKHQLQHSAQLVFKK